MRAISSITNLLAKDKTPVILLILLSSLLAIDPFLHRGIFTSHDIEVHIANLGAFYNSFMEGNIIPRWAKDLSNGYGGPILMFSYSIPYYLGLPFRLLGFSLIDCIKILNLLTFVGSALFMYFFLRCYSKTFPSFMGSLFYVFAPYRISNIYARGSVAENTAFLFIPLAALSLAKYWTNPTMTKIILLAFSFSLIILSHPFFAIITAPFFIGFIIILFFDSRSWSKLSGIVIALIFTLGLTAYFSAPLLIENKYTHFDINPFINTYKTEGITVSQLIIPQWSFIDKSGKVEYQTWQLGLVNIVLFFISLLVLARGLSRKKALLTLGLVLFVTSGFLSLKIALPLYEVIKPLRQVQFPWRFLALNVVSLPLLATISFSVAENKLKKRFYILGVLIIGSLLIFNLPYAKGHNYYIKTDSYYLYQIIYNTQGVAVQPRWSALPDFYPKKTAQLQIIDGQGTIQKIFINSTLHRYEITAATPLYLVDNTFYFPGWQVNMDKQETPIEFQNENYRGLITFHVPQGSHEVEVGFKNTKLRSVAEKISLATFIATVFFLLISQRFAQRKIIDN